MAKKKEFVDIDFNQNQLLNPVLQNLPDDPETGVEGQKYFNTTNHIERTYRNGAWQNATDEYELPAASTTTRGGIKVGNRLYIENEDVLNVHRASKVIEGIGRFATDAEVEAGTQPNVAIDPVQLKSIIDSITHTTIHFINQTIVYGDSKYYIDITNSVTSFSQNDLLYIKLTSSQFTTNGNEVYIKHNDNFYQIKYTRPEDNTLTLLTNRGLRPSEYIVMMKKDDYFLVIENKLTKYNIIWGIEDSNGNRQVKLIGDYSTNQEPINGQIALIKFTNTNTATNPYLNVKYQNLSPDNAKPIKYKGTVITTTNLDKAGKAGCITCYIYYNGYWEWLFDTSSIDYSEISNTPDLTVYKTKQTAVVDPTASGTSFTFISSITQNANGEIVASKKNLPIPVPTVSDEDKLLSVNSSGQYVLITIINSELIPY